MKIARLILEDGSQFVGWSFGYEGALRPNGGRPSDREQHSDICVGEVVFNTAMTGYPESLTDPSSRESDRPQLCGSDIGDDLSVDRQLRRA